MKPYRIAVLHWGAKPEYQKLLQRWFKELSVHLPASADVVVLTDKSSPVPDIFKDGKAWPLVWRVDPHVGIPCTETFDYKGALVCAALLDYPGPLLVVDADAFVRHDPTTLLEAFADQAIAMPQDEGAPGLYLRNTDGTNSPALKRCAGVMWFGGAERSQLVHDYKRAFRSFRYGNYLEARRLAEQHAWSLVAHWHKSPLLPRELNWPEHFKVWGPNSHARIVHFIGKKKWAKSPSGAVSLALPG